MKTMVLGSGQMGKAVAYDLARNDKVTDVIVADIDIEHATSVADFVGKKAEAIKVNAAKRDELVPLFKQVDAVASCVSYTVNLLHTELAIETGTHMCDLGGNFKVVRSQLELDSKAKKAGVTVIPDCGLAPGMVNVLARAGVDYLDNTDSVRIRVGGLQQEPRPPLNYSLIFSVEGLINEYVEPCMVLKGGKIEYEEPLIGFEQIEFPNPFGVLEAFNTSGGTSTLPLTYKGKIDELNYKTIRYPGHGHKMWTLMKLGLMDSEEMEINGVKIAPRTVLEKLLEEKLPETGKDVTLLRILIEGWKSTESRIVEYELIDYFDNETGLTSMMRTTAFPASVTTMMMADGRVSEHGVLPPEVAIPPEEFIQEMQTRGLDIQHRVR